MTFSIKEDFHETPVLNILIAKGIKCTLNFNIIAGYQLIIMHIQLCGRQ